MRALVDNLRNNVAGPANVCFVVRNGFATFQAVAESYINVLS